MTIRARLPPWWAKFIDCVNRKPLTEKLLMIVQYAFLAVYGDLNTSYVLLLHLLPLAGPAAVPCSPAACWKFGDPREDVSRNSKTERLDLVVSRPNEVDVCIFTAFV